MKAIISVIGQHAGCSIQKILKTKIEDIQIHGYCLWVICSKPSSPPIAIPFFAGEETAPIYFISASGATKRKPDGNAAPTKTRKIASEYSVNKKDWISLPSSMNPVTGALSHGTAHALFLNKLELCEEEFDLSYWTGADGVQPIKFHTGVSSSCSIRRPDPLAGAMKANRRQVPAIGLLGKPFSVYLR